MEHLVYAECTPTVYPQYTHGTPAVHLVRDEREVSIAVPVAARCKGDAGKVDDAVRGGPATSAALESVWVRNP